MKIIKPAEIAAKIMTLIDEADEELIIVSAYNNLSDWDKLKKHFQGAISRNIKINYFVRAKEQHRGLNELGIQPTPIKNLHAKFYMNEKYAIVTSMNLVHYSDTYSLDIGYLVDNEEELFELKDYYTRFIKTQDNRGNSFSLNLSEDIRNEPVFLEYFNRDSIIDNYNVDKLNFQKEYYKNSFFIKSCGYTKRKKKIGTWLYFNKYGFVEKTGYHYENGKNEYERVVFNHNVSRYDILFSIANIVSSLYQVSIENLYFKSKLHDYILEGSEKLFDYLAEYLKIPFHDYELDTFEQLNEIVLWYLKGNNGRCDYYD